MGLQDRLPLLVRRQSAPSSVLTGAAPYSLDIGEDDLLTGVNIWSDGGLVGLQILFEDTDGAAQKSAPVTRPGLTLTTEPTAAVVLQAGERLTGVTGTRADRQAGGHVTSLTLRTTTREIPVIPGASGSTFAIDFASVGVGAVAAGFFGEASATGLSIGLSAFIRGPFSIGQPKTLWVNRDAGLNPPVEDKTAELTGTTTLGAGDKNLGIPNGTWLATEISRVVQEGETLRVVREDRDDEVFRFVGLKPAPAAAPLRMLYRSEANQRMIEVELPIGRGTLQVVDDKSVTRPKPPLGGSTADRQTWGGTFTLPERTTFDDYLFRGHDIFRTNPQNMQKTDGLKQFVFKYPDDDSKDFHTHSTDSGIKVAANGSFFVPKVEAGEYKVTYAASTETEYQESWTQSAGGKVGVGKESSFSANAEFRQSVTNGVSNAAGSTVSIARQFSYVHVLDKALVTLDPTFVSRVRELLDEMAQGETPRVAGFLEAFGTHYANAVTFGGMYFQERHFKKAGMLKKLEAGISVEVEASSGFGPFSASVNAKESNDRSDSVKRDNEDETDLVRAIGGELSTGGGFHLGGKSVPILMDLRPLPDILNPVYFPDSEGVDRAALAQLRELLFVTILEQAESLPKFGNTSRLPGTVFEIQIFDVLALQGNLTELSHLEINLSTTGRATAIANSHPSGPAALVNGPLRNTLVDGVGTLEDLRLQTKDRFYIATGARVSVAGQVRETLPESKFNLTLTVRGKWRNPQDRDIENLLLTPVGVSFDAEDGDPNSGPSSLRYSDFTTEMSFARFRVPRSGGEIIVRIGFRNAGLPLAFTAAGAGN